MIDHDDVYCDVIINGNELTCDLKHIQIHSQLDHPFSVSLSLACTEALSFFQKHLYQSCALKISSQTTPARYINGILTQVILINKNIHQNYIYTLTIKPAISLYADVTYPFLFNGISVIDIAKQILSGKLLNNDPSTCQEYAINLKGDRDYPPLYRILMRDESILEFFNRILSYQGLTYFFDYTHEKSPLIITDTLNHIATSINTPYIPHSPHALTLNPYIETFNFINNNNFPQKVLSSGAPRLEPHTLLSEATSVITINTPTLYHINTNEQLDKTAKTRAIISSLALQGEQNTASFIGGGLLFAGMKLNLLSNEDLPNTWLIRTSTIEITFDEHDSYRLGSMATKVFAQDATIRYQSMPQFGEHATLMSGIRLGTPSTDKGANLISVNEQGHYHTALPINISSNLEAQGVQVFDTRMLQPMHSNDHSSHLTLPSDSEGILLWSEGFSGEPLILGTLNNLDNTHPTTTANPQNAYWQDNDTNKLGFINEGSFTPYQKTGRNTASIMETPSYDPANHKSYVRMGDAIANDSQYPSQAAEPGLFLNTSGNYQEQHQGGIVAVAGNLNQDSQTDGYTPTLRHMVQLAPILGTYNILDSTTTHLHNTQLTSDNVTETHNQDPTTIIKNLNAKQNIQNYNADTIDNIYVNQSHQSQGDYTSAIYNNHTLNSQSITTSILKTGDQTSETHDTHTLNLNHLHNQLNTETQETNIDSQSTAVTTLTQNFTHYSGQGNTMSVNSQNTNIAVGSANIGGNNFKQGGLLSVNNSGGSPSIPPIQSINQQGIATIEDEQTPQKKEIVFLLDCPQNPPQLQLAVNNINPMTIAPNSIFTYPLTDEQKKGKIILNNQSATQELQSTLHPEVRKINMQYAAPAEAQMPNAYFNQKGQLPIYQGIMDLEAHYGIPNNMVDLAYSLMCFDTSSMPKNINQGQSNIANWSKEAINWLKEQLEQSVGDINTWVTSASGNDAADAYDNITMLTDKDNQTLIKGFIKSGLVKITQVGDKVMVSFPYTKEFKAYISFFLSSGGSVASMASQIEADKAGYFAQKGIRLIRIAKTFAKMSPEEKRNFTKAVSNYKAMSGKDSLIDLIIINAFDLIKKEITHESLKDYIADVVLDNFTQIASMIFLLVTDGITAKSKPVLRFSLRIFGEYYVSGVISDHITKYEKKNDLHNKIANSNMVNRAADFMNNFYQNNVDSNTIKNNIDKLIYLIQHGIIAVE